MPHPLAQRDALVFSHLGFYVRDIERMARFYKGPMGFFETDRGLLGTVQLVFLSRDPGEHHQIVLASGRPEGAGFNLINQISLRVPDLATPRRCATAWCRTDISELITATQQRHLDLLP